MARKQLLLKLSHPCRSRLYIQYHLYEQLRRARADGGGALSAGDAHEALRSFKRFLDATVGGALIAAWEELQVCKSSADKADLVEAKRRCLSTLPVGAMLALKYEKKIFFSPPSVLHAAPTIPAAQGKYDCVGVCLGGVGLGTADSLLASLVRDEHEGMGDSGGRRRGRGFRRVPLSSPTH